MPLNVFRQDKIGAATGCPQFLTSVEMESFKNKALAIHETTRDHLVEFLPFPAMCIWKTSKEGREFCHVRINSWLAVEWASIITVF
jgi:hypothetical protein